MSLGDWASIATLALFVIYFAGRIITIFRMQPLESNEISVEPVDIEHNKYNLVEEFSLDPEPTCAVVVKSITGIRSFKIYQLIYDEDMNRIGREATAMTLSFINIGQAIAIYLSLPETLPWYEIEYRTMDYRKLTLSLVDNMKDGVITEGLVARHTVKSVLYNLLK